MHSKPLKKWSFTHDKLFHFSGKPQKFVLIKRRNFVLSFTYNWSSKLTNDIIRKIMTYSKFYLWTFGVHICGQEALLLFGVIPKTNCLLPVTSNWFGVLWFFRGNRADAVVVLVSFWKCDSHGLPLPPVPFSIDHISASSKIDIFSTPKNRICMVLGWPVLTDIFQPFLGTLTKFGTKP